MVYDHSNFLAQLHMVGIYQGGFFELIRVTFFNFEGFEYYIQCMS